MEPRTPPSELSDTEGESDAPYFPANEQTSAAGTVPIGSRVFWLLNLLWVPQALVILYLIAAYAVDLPNIDQWDGELPFLEKVAAGTATFWDLIAPQLEHRVGTNRAIGLFVAKAFDWNHKVECAFAWLFACGCAVNLCILSCRTRGSSIASRSMQIALMGALLFSIGQFPSWTNCFGGIQWLSIEFYLTAGLVIAGSPPGTPVRFWSCTLLALFSTFSSSNGLLLWLLLLPSLFLLREDTWGKTPARWIAAWGVCAAIAIAGYFTGFERSDGRGPSILEGLQNPVRFVGFFFANIGSPFAHGTVIDPATQAVVVGIVLFGLLVAALCHVLRHRSDRALVCASLPWITLGLYAFATGAAITLGRAAGGISEAIAARFTTIHVLTPIALIFLLPIVCRDIVRRQKLAPGSVPGVSFTRVHLTAACASLATALILLHTCYSAFSLKLYPFYFRMFSEVKAAVLFVKCFQDDSLLKWAWTAPSPEMIRRAEFLDAQGWLRPGLFRSPRIESLKDAGYSIRAASAQNGAIEQAGRQSENVIVLSGWAAIPERGIPAPAVLLSWETMPGDATIFAVAEGGPHRMDIAERLVKPDYRWAGWNKAINLASLPKENLTIRAWGFDPESRSVVEVSGALPVSLR